jgi:hypothetical protein
VGRRRRGAQGRAEGRVRDRVRDRGQGHTQQGRPQHGRGSGTRRGTFDVGEIEGYANRLKDQLGGRSGTFGGSGTSGGSGLSGAAAGLAGAASGLAGGSLASRLTGGATQGSEEDFRNEIRERLDLIDERVQRLEDEMVRLLEGAAGDPTEPASPADPEPGP